VLRTLSVLAAALIVGASCAGCNSTPKSASGTSRPLAASGNLVVKVTSVTATLEPYNPQIANAGIPAEQVSFIVRSIDLPLSCTIDVLRSGRTVGSTVVGLGASTGTSGLVTETVPVEGITGGTFAGSPANAHVLCPPATSGNLVVKVTSVTADLLRRNPQIAGQGNSLERVSFTIRSIDLPVSCRIDVVRSGRTVSSSVAGLGSRTGPSGLVTETIPVEVTGGSFAGSPANAHVFCRAV
jgi:hypothetical protein